MSLDLYIDIIECCKCGKSFKSVRNWRDPQPYRRGELCLKCVALLRIREVNKHAPGNDPRGNSKDPFEMHAAEEIKGCGYCPYCGLEAHNYYAGYWRCDNCRIKYEIDILEKTVRNGVGERKVLPERVGADCQK